VLRKLQESDEKLLREELKTKDWNGFSFLVYLVKRFVEITLPKFSRSFMSHFNRMQS
jgi:hypothetical protein